jgi:hypothetical protein
MSPLVYSSLKSTVNYTTRSGYRYLITYHPPQLLRSRQGISPQQHEWIEHSGQELPLREYFWLSGPQLECVPSSVLRLSINSIVLTYSSHSRWNLHLGALLEPRRRHRLDPVNYSRFVQQFCRQSLLPQYQLPSIQPRIQRDNRHL